jgi:hypothetical protein
VATRLKALAAALFVVVTMVGLVTQRPASACSCEGPGDLRKAIAAADGAFVGMYVSRDDPQGGGPSINGGRSVVNHFRVERAIKGPIGATIDVVAAADGATCGLEVPPGGRIGLFVKRQGSEWSSNLCSQVDPDALLAAANAAQAHRGNPRFTG